MPISPKKPKVGKTAKASRPSVDPSPLKRPKPRKTGKTGKSGKGTSLGSGPKPIHSPLFEGSRTARTPNQNKGRAPEHVSATTKVDTSFVKKKTKPSFDEEGLHLPSKNGEFVFSRRQLLIGAAGAAGVAAVAAGASTINNAREEQASVKTLSVATDDVITLNDCTEANRDDMMTLVGSYKLPHNSMVWSNSDSVAVVLLPTQTVKPLATVAILDLETGTDTTVLERAIGESEGFEIFDVRCTDKGMVWAEADIIKNVWRIYTATLSGSKLGTPRMVDEGDSENEMPTLAAVGDYAFWQTIPAENEGDTARSGTSTVKRAPFSDGDAETIFTTEGRMITPICADESGITVTPLYEETSTYRQLTRIDAASGEVRDTVTLPSRMTPLEAGYGRTGFMFSFESIYNYGEGISTLGTYTPTDKHAQGDYKGLEWFRYGRTPSMPPCWCDDLLLVKSTTAVVAVDPLKRTYAVLGVESGIASYGDCLATTGDHGTVVTFMNIDNAAAAEVGADKNEFIYSLVRVWKKAGTGAVAIKEESDTGE